MFGVSSLIFNFSMAHTMTLHAMTLYSTSFLVRILHRSKPSVGSPFRDLENQLCILSGSLTNHTNQPHSHTFRETSQKVIHLITTPSQARLTMEFLSHRLLKIRCITNGIIAYLCPSTVQFEDKPGRSWWACNTMIESHQCQRNLEAVQIWDCTVEDNLKELIGTIYTNKMHLLFGSPSLKNFIVKRV